MLQRQVLEGTDHSYATTFTTPLLYKKLCLRKIMLTSATQSCSLKCFLSSHLLCGIIFHFFVIPAEFSVLHFKAFVYVTCEICIRQRLYGFLYLTHFFYISLNRALPVSDRNKKKSIKSIVITLIFES